MHVAHHCLLFSVLMQVRAVCAALDLGGKWSAYSRPRQLPACGAAVEGRGLCSREGLPPGDHTAQGGRQMSKELLMVITAKQSYSSTVSLYIALELEVGGSSTAA